MDDFEKHISKNKQLFDEHVPDKAKIWGAIVQELDKKEARVIPLWKSSKFLIAASIVLIFGIFSLLGLSVNSSSNNMANQELNEIDIHYQNLVSYQVKLVENSTHLSPEDKKEFLSFLDELDEEYKVLKLELSQNLDNELVLEAIISNYKKRIELIEKLLKQVNNSKKTENDDEYVL